MTVEEFAEMLDVTLIVKRPPNPPIVGKKSNRWMASIDGISYKEFADSSTIGGQTGRGPTPDAALLNLVGAISGMIAVKGNGKDRQTFRVPDSITR